MTAKINDQNQQIKYKTQQTLGAFEKGYWAENKLCRCYLIKPPILTAGINYQNQQIKCKKQQTLSAFEKGYWAENKL